MLLSVQAVSQELTPEQWETCEPIIERANECHSVLRMCYHNEQLYDKALKVCAKANQESNEALQQMFKDNEILVDRLSSWKSKPAVSVTIGALLGIVLGAFLVK